MPMTSSSLIFCVHNCVPIIVSVLYSCRFFMIAPCSVATSSFNSHWKHQTPKCLLIAGSTEALGGPRLHNKWFLDYECLTSFHKEDPILRNFPSQNILSGEESNSCHYYPEVFRVVCLQGLILGIQIGNF